MSGRSRSRRPCSLALVLMLTVAPAFAALGLLTLAPAPVAASPDWGNLTGGDHGGEDWIITVADNLEIADNHYNIGLFKIEAGVTVTVKDNDGTNYGWVEIHADNIVIEGALMADSAGPPGDDLHGDKGGNISLFATDNIVIIGSLSANGEAGGGTSSGCAGSGGTGGTISIARGPL